MLPRIPRETESFAIAWKAKVWMWRYEGEGLSCFSWFFFFFFKPTSQWDKQRRTTGCKVNVSGWWADSSESHRPNLLPQFKCQQILKLGLSHQKLARRAETQERRWVQRRICCSSCYLDAHMCLRRHTSTHPQMLRVDIVFPDGHSWKERCCQVMTALLFLEFVSVIVISVCVCVCECLRKSP